MIVVPMPKCSGFSCASVTTATFAVLDRSMKPSTVGFSRKLSLMRSIVMAAATSPAACPPMPSAMMASESST